MKKEQIGKIFNQFKDDVLTEMEKIKLFKQKMLLYKYQN